MTAGFEYVGPTAPTDQVEGFFGAERNAALDLVGRHPGSVTSVLASRLRCSQSNALKLLRELEQRGQIERRGSGTKSDPISWFVTVVRNNNQTEN